MREAMTVGYPTRRRAGAVRDLHGSRRQDPTAVSQSTNKRWLAFGYALLGLALAAYLLNWLLIPSHLIDLRVYRAEGRAVWTGRDLYHLVGTPYGLQAVYPPFASLCFVPLAWLPIGALRIAADGGNVALTIVLVRLSWRLAGAGAAHRARGRVAVPLLSVAAIWSEPVHTTVVLGQIDLVLVALVLADLGRLPRLAASGRTGTSRWIGVGVGIASGIKLTPAIFILYLLLTKRFRAAGTAFGTFVGTVALSFAVLPHAAAEYWTKLVFDTGRVGGSAAAAQVAQNQSLRGVLARMAQQTALGWTWPVIAGLTCIAGVWTAVAVSRHSELAGLLCCAVTGLLICPISWTHHWVWLVVVAVAVTAGALERGVAPGWLAALGIVCLAGGWLFLTVPGAEFGVAWWQQLLQAPEVIAGSVILVATSGACVARRRRTANAGGAEGRAPERVLRGFS